MKNKDDHCVRWALRAVLFPVARDPHRPTKYPTEDGLNFDGIGTLMPISQIPKIERQNDLAINIFRLDEGIIVYRFSKQPGQMPRINLLLTEMAGQFHYTWVQDIN